MVNRKYMNNFQKSEYIFYLCRKMNKYLITSNEPF